MGLFNPSRSDFTPAKSNMATPFAITAGTNSVALLPVNEDRNGATIYNDSTAKLYLKLGATASTADFTVILEGNGYYEVPFSYTGEIAGVWSAANGVARIEELT